MDPIIVTACVLGVVGTAVALALRAALDRRRLAAMRDFAMSNQLSFQAADDELDGMGLSRLPIIRSGLDRNYLHVARRTLADGDELVFDYQHRIGTLLTALTEDSLVADAVIGMRKNRGPSYYNMTFVARRITGAMLRSFVIRNGRVVEGDVPASLLSALSGLPAHVHAEGGGEWLAVYRFDRRHPIEQLPALRRAAERLARDLAGPATVSQPPRPQRRLAL